MTAQKSHPFTTTWFSQGEFFTSARKSTGDVVQVVTVADDVRTNTPCNYPNGFDIFIHNGNEPISLARHETNSIVRQGPSLARREQSQVYRDCRRIARAGPNGLSWCATSSTFCPALTAFQCGDDVDAVNFLTSA
jgi:hypothetical protein